MRDKGIVQYGTFIVPATEGASFHLDTGDQIKIINDHGTQVVDFWCLSFAKEMEYLSMGHSREVLSKIYFDPGDVLVSNRYSPLLEYVEDTSGGNHDTLIAACSKEMYIKFGCRAGHASCASNFDAAARQIDWPLYLLPQPWNLFMRAAVKVDGKIEYTRPPFNPGGRVELKALCPVLIIVSACPDDCYPTNGADGSSRSFSVSVQSAQGEP